MAEGNQARWWEQYYVRYFVGTVIGVVVIFGLRDRAVLAAQLRDFIPASKDIDAAEFTAVALAGLAFCYIASAPILTLHGLRGDWLRIRWGGRKYVVAGLYLLVASGLGLSAFLTSADALEEGSVIWIGRGVLFLLVSGQLLLLCRASNNGFEGVRQFYLKLGGERSPEQNKGEYIDSYRHLREHGNAVWIVIMEIFLGLILASATSMSQVVCFVLLWLLPATGMWFVGTQLENELTK